MKDRRQFYRINDKISLNYRIIEFDHEHQDGSKTEEEFNEFADMRNTLFCIDARLEDISTELTNVHPLISEMLTLLNKKITLHEHLSGINTETTQLNTAREVNLSANGVAFETDEAIENGTNLRIEMIMFPENHYVPVYARVVSCRKLKGESSAYSIAVEYVTISDKDEERIIHHILKKQAEELKLKREEETLALGESA